MKNANRFFAFLLACLFSFGALAACDSDTPAPGTEGTTALPGSDTAPVTEPGHETEPPADEGPVISDAAKGINIATDEMLAQWDAMIEAKRQEILSTPNMDVSGFKKVYYVSPNGDDSNDGLSPETAWKTIEKLNSKYMGKDTCVCFERGGIYRGMVTVRQSVTYTAYGEGAKPEIWGSPMNGAEVGTWEEVAPNIWRYSEPFAADVGLLVMNGGEEWANKILIDYRQDPPIEWRADSTVGTVWEGYVSLNENYEFWHDLNGMRHINNENPGYIYLYCDKGNPADVWDDIEFNPRGSVFDVQQKSFVTIDNISVKYCGASGIAGGGPLKELKVTNCTIGWVGGSLMGYLYGYQPTRYGNGCDIYGHFDGFYVDNCWVYQCYDTGLSFQVATEIASWDSVLQNVHYTNNLIEKCNWSIEYFQGGPHPESPEGLERCIKNIYITDNILADASYGFSEKTRPDYGNGCHVKSWTHWNHREGDFVFEDNLLIRGATMVLDMGAETEEDLPDMKNNVFVQTDRHLWGNCCPNSERVGLGRLIYSFETVSHQRYAGNEFFVIPYAE